MFAIGLAGIALGGLMAWAWLSDRSAKPSPLPSHWAISPRPVFNTRERRLYRQLKDAFPQHVVMPKLPLVRLCQPDDLGQVQYWYGLLGSTHVTFTICSPSGKALLAIDLESRRSHSKRSIEIKEAVLAACQVKYFSIAADGMPTITALRLLMPNSGATATAAESSRDTTHAPVESAQGDVALTASAGTGQRAKSSGPWRDPSLFLEDSFFAPDSRLESANDASHPVAQAAPGPQTEAAPTSRADRPAVTEDMSDRVVHPELDVPDSARDWNRLSDVGGIVVDDRAAPAPEETSARSTAAR